MSLVKGPVSTSNRSWCCYYVLPSLTLSVVDKKGLISRNKMAHSLRTIFKKTEVESIQSENKIGFKGKMDFSFCNKAPRPSG